MEQALETSQMPQTPQVAPGYCPDCGPVGVRHWIERFSARLDPILDASTKPMQWIWLTIRPGVYALKLEHIMPYFYHGLAALRLGSIVTQADERNNWRARVLWAEAERRGIAMREFRPFGLPREIFWAKYGDDVRIFDGLPRPRLAPEAALAWMDDKGMILKKFRAAGVPVPRGGICKTIAEAERVFNEIAPGAVIVKPNIGSRSRHTYVDIVNLADLRHAFLKAKELTPYPVVEEQLCSFVFRITLVGGKVAGIMRREPPHVIGDGKHTIIALVEEENKNPLRHGPIFHELHLDDDAQAILAKQSLSADATPANGRMVVLNEKVSRAYGASTTEFDNSEVHPDNLALFGAMAKVIDDPLVGIDFMIEDITRSWREQPKTGVIECNSLPFIDLHHYPLRGNPKNVAGFVWDLAF